MPNDPITLWEALVDTYTAKGLPRARAVSKAVKEHPEAHRAYLDAYNELHAEARGISPRLKPEAPGREILALRHLGPAGDVLVLLPGRVLSTSTHERNTSMANQTIADIPVANANANVYTPMHAILKLFENTRGQKLYRLHAGLVAANATLADGQAVRPDHPEDALAWLLDQLT